MKILFDKPKYLARVVIIKISALALLSSSHSSKLYILIRAKTESALL